MIIFTCGNKKLIGDGGLVPVVQIMQGAQKP